MDKYKFPPKLLIGLLIAVFFLTALSFRTFLPYDQVFVGDWIKFTSNDAYYHMRLVDILVYNFPNITRFDPFFIYPEGIRVIGIHFFDWILSAVIWIAGLGAPTQHTVDVIGVYFPAVLGALVVIPVYFIGKALFNKWAGVLAAALVAMLPGEFLGRSILGFTDHHVAESLFSTVTVLFLILAIKEAGQKQLTFSHLIQSDRKVIVRPLVYSLLAGIFLGLYLIIWIGGLLFVFIFSLYLIFQFIIDQLRHKSSDHLGIVGFISFLVALIIFLLDSPPWSFSVAMVMAVFVPPVLSGVSLLISRRRLKPIYYPVALVVIGIVFIAVFYVIAPYRLTNILSNFSLFNPAGATATTTLEMQPFLSPQGSFSTLVAWGNFTTNFFLTKPWPIPGFGLVSFIILIYLFIKRRSDEKHLLLFFVWTLVILVATLAQRRFAYYLVVNIAVLSAYISWQIIWLAGLRKLVTSPEEKPEKEYRALEAPRKRDYYEILGIARGASHKEIRAAFRKLSAEYHADQNRTPETEERFKEITRAYEVLSNPGKRVDYDRARHEISERKKTKSQKERQGITIHYINVILAIIVVFFFVFFWNITKSREVASEARFAPTDAWEEALSWMRGNTPDPFGDPDAYYRLYQPPPAGENFTYPRSAYGVVSWWDYGYWVTRTARRLPITNPSQASEPITLVAKILLSKEASLTQTIQKIVEEEALSQVTQNKTEEEKFVAEEIQRITKELDKSYTIIDYTMTTSKFWAILTWAGQEQSNYIGVYYMPYQGKLIPIQVFYPEYYRSMCVRLYNFDGKAITEGKPMVFAYDEKVNSAGDRYRQITDFQEFSSYKEALNYVESKGAANHVIVGANPFISPIPLDMVPDYKLLYSSKSGILHQDAGMIPEVKIFAYTGQ